MQLIGTESCKNVNCIRKNRKKFPNILLRGVVLVVLCVIILMGVAKNAYNNVFAGHLDRSGA